MQRATAPLLEIALFFLRLGATAFGGPAAHIAVMREELVKKRKWVTEERFLDLLGAANLIPGPSSTELAIFLGHVRGGWFGLVIAGVSFILPASLITAGIAALYVHYGALPELKAVLYGLKPVIIAVVVQALWGLGRAAIKNRALLVLAAGAAAVLFLEVNPLIVLFGSGTIAALARRFTRTAAAAAFDPLLLFVVFLKIGAVLFGSGYVLLAFLRADLVEGLGWLTEGQLLDAVAVGQVTPGPVFTTATFIGYLLGGGSGALLATVGIFLPGFVFVAAAGPLVPRLRASATAGAFLDGVNVATVALMAVVTWHLGWAALVDPWTIGLCVVSAVALVFFRASSILLLCAGALLGFGLELLGVYRA